MDSAFLKTHKRGHVHQSKISGRKVIIPDGFWRLSWIYADYESSPKLPSWQQSWICSRTQLYYECMYGYILCTTNSVVILWVKLGWYQ